MAILTSDAIDCNCRSLKFLLVMSEKRRGVLVIISQFQLTSQFQLLSELLHYTWKFRSSGREEQVCSMFVELKKFNFANLLRDLKTDEKNFLADEIVWKEQSLF